MDLSRFVAVKLVEQQAGAIAYRTRDLLVRQRTQKVNALRAHLAEQGIVAPVGPGHVGRLAPVVYGDDGALPSAVRDLARLLLDQIAGLSEKVADLDTEFSRRASTDDTAQRLSTISGKGPITCAAITTFAPPMKAFSKGRGKERLGQTSNPFATLRCNALPGNGLAIVILEDC